MKLSDKIRYLREVEGNLRGLNRAMTQQELVRAIEESNKESNKPNPAAAKTERRSASPTSRRSRAALDHISPTPLACFSQSFSRFTLAISSTIPRATTPS